MSDFGQFTYQPASHDESGASFTFTVIDSSGAESQVQNTLTLAISVTEDQPTSADTAQTTLEDINHSFAENQFTFADVDTGDFFNNLLIVNTVTNGRLVLNNVEVGDNQTIAVSDLANLIYEPVAHDVAGSFFNFRVEDNKGTLSAAIYTFTLNITPDADAPTAQNTSISIDEDAVHNFAANDFDFADEDAGDTLAKILFKNFAGQGSLLFNGSAVAADDEIDVADLSNLTYQTAANDIQPSTLEYRVIDSSSQSLVSAANTVLTLNINPIADNPTASDNVISVVEDSAYTLKTADFGFADVDGDTFAQVRVESWSGNGDLAYNGSNVAVGDLIDVSTLTNLIFTPTTNDVNDGLFSFKVVDSANDESLAQLITFDIAPEDDMPTSADKLLTLNEDVSHTFALGDFAFDDVDGDAFKEVQIVTLPARGTLTVNASSVGTNQLIAVADIPSMMYQPELHEELGSAFTFKVIDSADNVSKDTYDFTFQITPQVDEPTAADNTLTLLEDGQRSFTAADFNFADVDTGDTLKSVQIITDVSVGELELNGQAVNVGDSIAFADLADLTYVAQDDDMGGSSFTFRVTDSADLSSLADYTMTLAITPQSDPPTASGTQISVTEDVVHQFSTSEFGFDDVDNDTFAKLLIVSVSGQGSYEFNGAPITIGAQGQEIPASDMANLRYLPALHDVSGGSFEYKVVDSTNEESQQYTMTMQIDAEPDKPTTSNTTVNVTEDILHQFAQGDFAFDDVDGDAFAAIIFKGFTGQGDLLLNANPLNMDDEITVAQLVNLTYQTALNDHTNSSFEYLVKDTSGDISVAPATLTLDIAADPDDPTASDKTVTVTEDIARTFTAADFSFVDVDGESFDKVRIGTFSGQGDLLLNGQTVGNGTEIDVNDFGQFIYQPQTHDESGANFTFTVIDSSGAESQALNTLTLAISVTEDQPTSADTAQTTLEDTNHAFAENQFTFADVDSGDFFNNLLIVNTVINGRLVLNNVEVGDNQTIAVTDLANLIYEPVAHDVAGSSFTFRVEDNKGTLSAATYTFTLNITPESDTPTAADNTLTLLEDDQHGFDVSEFGFADVDIGNTLAFVELISTVTTGSLELNGQVLNGGERIPASDIANLVYVAEDDDFNGSQFTFAVEDNTGEKSLINYTMTLAITATSDDPTLSITNVEVTEDVPHQFSVTEFGFNDVDTDTFKSLRFVTNTGQGSFVLRNAATSTDTAVQANQLITVAEIGNLIYSPALHDTTGGNFTVIAIDSTDTESDPVTITLSILAEPDAPTAQDLTVDLVEDTPLDIEAADFGFVDVDGDAFQSLDVIETFAMGELVLDEVAVLTGQSLAFGDLGRLKYQPAKDDILGSAMRFKVTDSTGHQSEAENTFTIQILADDDLPIGADKEIRIDEDQNYTFVAEDFGYEDPETPLSFVRIESLPLRGELLLDGLAVSPMQQINADDIADLTYETDDHHFGLVELSFKVNDGLQDSALSYTFAIDIQPINDAPTSDNNEIVLAENTSHLFNITDFAYEDIDVDPLHSVFIQTLPTLGQLTKNGQQVSVGERVLLNEMSQLLYTPTADSIDPTAFDFVVSDGLLTSSVHTQSFIFRRVTPDDLDGDGILNVDDRDTDGDGIENNIDPDIDGDGIPNGLDSDMDGDGEPNITDNDLDGDGMNNAEDSFEPSLNDIDGDGFPNDQDLDVDGDGIANEFDADIDGDGIVNGLDSDMDADGLPNSVDDDIDGDGVANLDDPVTPDLNDLDGDGIANADDPDVDGDNKPNSIDEDIDGDGTVNGLDVDMDGDGVVNSQDEDSDGDFQEDDSDLVIANSDDLDGDGIDNGTDLNVDGDADLNGVDADADGDGTINGLDSDADGDGTPNSQDSDADGDGIDNQFDSPMAGLNDLDGDGIPNELDPDIDGDGKLNTLDADMDGDGILNGLDSDMDGDGTVNALDDDMDGDGIVNVDDMTMPSLDDLDGDGLPNAIDTDIDGDGIDNRADPDMDGDGTLMGSISTWMAMVSSIILMMI